MRKLQRLSDVDIGVEVRPYPEERRRNHRGECSHYFDYQDARAARQQFELEKTIAEDELYGDQTDENPGALRTYEKHRHVEHLLSQYICLDILPNVAAGGDWKLHRELQELSYKFLFCRQQGPFGISGDGKLVIAWHEKCGASKYCPDEARNEAQRLRERYVPARAFVETGDHSRTILEHVKRGGRVYKAVISPPNYPAGRLREGMKYEMKRFRDRAIRAVAGGRNKWSIDGALVIQEAPLGRDRDWNIHLNVLLLTRGWFDYKGFQAAFGCSLKVRQHDRFDDIGIARLFNEIIKYSTRTVPEKSSDGNHDIAPSMIEWTPAEFLEWHKAQKGFRRTRPYGCLHGVGKPARQFTLPTRWIGKATYQEARYAVQWASDTFALAMDDAMWHAENGDLFLIRGDNSTTRRRQNGMRGPP
jgi:hypothetical protein